MMPLPGTWWLTTLLVLPFGYTQAQSGTGQVVTAIHTSTATVLLDCTCTQTFSRPLTKHGISTTSDLDATLTSTPIISHPDVPPAGSEKSADPAFVGTSGKESSFPSAQFTLSVCPTRISNPTYTPRSPLPTDYTWGCPPNYLCQPDKRTENGECNFEAGPPADTYYCPPEQCIPSPSLLQPQFGGQNVQSDQIGYFRVSPGYFNLNPHEFGLDYNIFLFPGQSESLKRELSIRIPGKCYDMCNDAMLEAESSGKTRDLCQTDSAFLTLVRSCQTCVASVDLSRISATTLPQFQQFLYYCKETSNSSSTLTISSTSRILIKTGLRPTKVTSSISKTVPTPTFNALVSATTASTRKTSTTDALIMGSMVSPFSKADTCSIRHPIELSTKTATNSATSSRKENLYTSSSISSPIFTGGASSLFVYWGFCFAPILIALYL